MLWVLILALITISGLVAYLGDQIGMKIGKKRLSIFGIRPKYTSIIITIFTGIVIATISISLLLLVSEGVRLAVFDMEQLLDQLGNLSSKVSEMESEILTTTAQLSDIKEEKGNLQSEKDELQSKLDLKKAEFHDLEAKLQGLLKTKMELEETKVLLDGKIVKLEEQKTELEKGKIELELQKHALEEEVDVLETDVATLKDQLNQSTELLDQFAKQATSLALSSNMYAQEVEKLRYKNELYRQQTVGYQSQSIIFRKGDIAYMESMQSIPQATEPEIVKAIDDLLIQANKALEKYSLKRNESDGRSILIPEYDLYMLAKALTDPANEKLIVWMQAKKNILINNFLEADLTWEADYRVFDQGEILATKEINSNQDPAQIEKELREMLGELSRNSIEKGLLPNASGEVGGIGFVDFYQIVEGIRNSSGKVRVTIQAIEDIWRPDSLSTENLFFEITRVGEDS